MTLFFASVVMAAVLLGPVLVEAIERNVEIFFLVVGLITAWIMGEFDRKLVYGAVTEPLGFTAAVLVFGAAFRMFRENLDRGFRALTQMVRPQVLCFGLAIVAGLAAPFVTPVVAALIFVEAIAMLQFDRGAEIAATVFACFAIGIGAGLTPLGMPGIAIVLRSLRVDFWYLARLLGPFIACGIVLAASPTLYLSPNRGRQSPSSLYKDPWQVVLLNRPARVYVFIAGLVALSDGLRPVVDAYIHRIPNALLFWINTISAIVNNSTLAALEIGPSLSRVQQRSALLGLLISGGALVTGNIPNIVAASRLGISSREWARVGLGMAALLLVVCFAVLTAISYF